MLVKLPLRVTAPPIVRVPAVMVIPVQVMAVLIVRAPLVTVMSPQLAEVIPTELVPVVVSLVPAARVRVPPVPRAPALILIWAIPVEVRRVLLAVPEKLILPLTVIVPVKVETVAAEVPVVPPARVSEPALKTLVAPVVMAMIPLPAVAAEELRTVTAPVTFN